MTTGMRPAWEYAQLAVEREPSPSSDWPITISFYRPDGQRVFLDVDDTVIALNAMGREGWELMGAPEVRNVVAAHTDSGGGIRDRAYWVERRFWLRRMCEP